MHLDKLRFIKNVDDDDNGVWAYQAWKDGDEGDLNWSAGQGNETNADKPSRGDLMLLVQKTKLVDYARVTHLVEVISDSSKTVGEGQWGLVRQVRVLWVADFTPGLEAAIPREHDILGWQHRRVQGTRAIELENIEDGKVLQLWHSMEVFQRHVAGILGLI